MSIGVQISIDSDPAFATLRELQSGLRPGPVNATASGAVARLLRAHFVALANERHGKAFPGSQPPSNFYADAARATFDESSEDGATVSVAHRGIRQRLLGGTIRPSGRTSPVTGRPITHLSIPARAEAYGRVPGEFDNLQPVFGRRGIVGLAETSATQISYKKSRGKTSVARGASVGGGIMFWLVDSITQAADPSVMPTADQISATIESAVTAYAKAAIARATQGVTR